MTGINYTDEELLEALRNSRNIEEPVKFIYSHFYTLLSIYIQQNGGSEQDAEDIFQETALTFIGLVQQGKFRGESSVKTFLYSINRNIWLNERKKKNRQDKRHERLATGMEHDMPEVEKFIASRETRKDIFSIIDSLGETCKEILIAFYYENLSMAEILKKVNYDNEQVVRNKKAKCMKTLKDKLNADTSMADIMKKALQYE